MIRLGKQQTGFVLATLIFFLTALSILIVVIVPVYKMQAKRAQEEELIFRGGEYIRAIQKFQRKFGAWPPSVDALIETNGLRFLRKAYKDPITDKAFRLITINPDGTVNGSVLFKPNNPFAPQGTMPGQQNPQSSSQLQPTGFGQPGQTQTSGTGFGLPPQTQQPGLPAQSGFQQQPGLPPQSGFQQQPGLPAQPGFQQQPGLPAQSGFQQQPGFQSQPMQQSQAGQPIASQTTNGTPASQTTGFPNQPGSSNPTAPGAGIIGVASDSDKTSIMVYNTYQKYNQWEFIAVQNRFPNQQQVPGQANTTGAYPGAGASAPGFAPTGATPGVNQPGMSQPGFNQTTPFGQPNLPGQSGQPNAPFGFGTPQPNPSIKPPGQ